MATTVKQWPDGGSLTIQYEGQGDGEIIVTSDPNTVYEARSMEFTVKTADGSVSITRTIQQAARQHIDISAAVVTASNQTYSGVAKTPTPTVTIDGATVPSSGYDVAYSNNTNAGTATITVTGKGDYTGTATGTFTIGRKSLSITAKAQTITYGSSISQSTSQVTTSGLVSGDSLTSITLTQSTSSVTSSGTITPSNAATSNGISNYSVSYYTGTLTITQATGYITFLFDSIGATYNPYDTTASLRVSTSSSGWEKTTAKTVSGYNVFRSISNKHKHNSSSVMKLTFVNNTGAAVTTTVKVGAATESSYDYVYIAQWNASDISQSSSTVPSSTIYSGSGKTAEWTDVSITIPTGTNTLQIVYRKDSSVSNEPDCGYFALPYNVSMASMVGSNIEYNTNASISYSSSNTSVVSVNSSTGAITINGVGSATITASASATTQYSSCSDTCTITVSAYKIPSTYTAPTLRTGLTYTGSSQYLTTSGSTSHGTIYYSTNNSNWYTSRRTGTTAGSYSCYWKLVGDTYHEDVVSTYLGSTTIAKASRTLSFADTYMVLNTSSSGTKTATTSAGSGDGAITYSISSTSYATINSSTGAVTSKTSDGSSTVTATIAEGTNYLGATATYTLYVFATTHNYRYTGSAKSVTLPPGTYQFQVWGAQGASCSDGYVGGKGGYSIGQLTTAEALAIQVRVGGQNGWNGGGSSTGSSSYTSGNTYGRSSMGNGGGASDIRLSDGALLSRMIVAGGGSGGAYCRREVTTEVEKTRTVTNSSSGTAVLGYDRGWRSIFAINTVRDRQYNLSVDIGTIEEAWWSNDSVRISNPSSFIAARTGTVYVTVRHNNGPNTTINLYSSYASAPDENYYTAKATEVDYKKTAGTAWAILPTDTAPVYGKSLTGGEKFVWKNSNYLWNGSSLYEAVCHWSCTETYEETYTDTETDVDTDYQTGYAGGGTNGVGYSSTYQGKQNAAGSDGSFGQGANQTTTNYRFCSGAGGGGWYGGGGGKYSDSSMTYCKYSGGGSGWVNTSASSGNRPSGYTGLELDSGTTYAGNTSFPSTGGGTETGHSGNGYVRITRL